MSILDFDLNKEAPFDPGYLTSVTRVSGNIEFLYQAFSSIPSQKQRRFQFMTIYPKILEAIELNVCFYLGCLLWGVYLKSLKPVPVVQNPCLGGVFDDSACEEIDFLINFTKTGLNRDVKYYLNKTYEENPLYTRILTSYREFLIMNEGFIKTKMTEDVKIPPSLKNPNLLEMDEIFNTIVNACKTDELRVLLKLTDKIL